MLVAAKKDDKIMVGVSVCDSLIDMTEKDLSLIENLPFWKVNGTNDCYVFADERNFAVELLRYNDHIFKNITDGNSIITTVVPKMKELLSKYLQVVDGKQWEGPLLIVKGNNMYSIGNFFTVTEVKEFVGFGYESYLLGSLYESKDKDLTESILFAVENLNFALSKNFFPLMVFDNQTKRRKFYYR